MSHSIAVIGAGPGLGLAVARRYAQDGHAVVLVARRQAQLDGFAADLRADGATVHTIAADLSGEKAGELAAAHISALVGTPDVIYYAPGIRGYLPVTDLRSDDLRALMGVAVYGLVDLVHRFLPDMVERGSGAVLVATAPSAVVGMPQLSATAVLAAQRNYLQALQAAVTDKGIYVGRLYIGATIANSAFHAQQEAARAAGSPVMGLPVVDPAHLAGLLREMEVGGHVHESIYPADLFPAGGLV